MKKFSLEGRVECGLDDAIAGKVAALVAVPSNNGWRLGVAIANEPGYIPVPETWCHADWNEREEIADHAETLNKEWFELDHIAAAKVVCSTMRRTPRRGS